MYVSASLIFAYIDCLILWFIQDRKEKGFENKKLINELGKLREDLDVYFEQTKKDPREELILKCRNAKLSKRDTQLAVMYYYEQQTPKEIWLWICQQKDFDYIEWDSIYTTLWRIGKKLNKN